MDRFHLAVGVVLLVTLASCATPLRDADASAATLAPCAAYPPPDAQVDVEVQHLKTTAEVLQVTSACTVRVRISGGAGRLSVFAAKAVVLRVTERTTYASIGQGDLGAIGRLGLRAGDVFTLSFDSRPFPDGSYPINFLNR